LSWLTTATVAIGHAQITPSQDAYTDSSSPTKNFGNSTTLGVESATQTTFIQFDLSSIPSGYNGSNVAKATLKLYVSAVATAGSFNVDYVNGSCDGERDYVRRRASSRNNDRGQCTAREVAGA